MDKEQRASFFARYEQGALTPEEQKQFNALLENDAAFKSEFELFKIGQLVSDRIYQKELEANFSEWEKERTSAKPGRRFLPLWIALLLIVALLGGMYLAGGQRSGDEKMPLNGPDQPPKTAPTEQNQAQAPAHLPPETDEPTHPAPQPRPSKDSRLALAIQSMQKGVETYYSRSSGPNESNKDSVLLLIKASRYQEALKRIDETPEKNNKPLYRGFILFYLKQYESAFAAFEDWKNLSNEVEKADWYMALCCTQMRHTPTSTCKELQRMLLQDSTHIFHLEALEIFGKPDK